MFPAHDEYRMWWERFCQVIDYPPGCDPPELWSFDADLRRPFQQLAATAHAAGTVIHVIDGGDPDRGLFGADGGGPVGLSSQGKSELITDGIQGGMYLASATGGSNELGIRASPEQGGSTLRVRVTIPLKALFTIDGKAQITCVVAVDGGDEGPMIISRRMDLAAPTVDGSPDALASVVIETGLPPSLNCVIGLLDEFSGAIGTVSLTSITRSTALGEK